MGVKAVTEALPLYEASTGYLIWGTHSKREDIGWQQAQEDLKESRMQDGWNGQMCLCLSRLNECDASKKKLSTDVKSRQA